MRIDSLKFAALLDFHLQRGTRPNGNPAVVGNGWSNAEFCEKISANERSVRNWRSGRASPNDLKAIEDSLFGSNPEFDIWRAELREAYQSCRRLPGRKADGIHAATEGAAAIENLGISRLNTKSNLTSSRIGSPGPASPPGQLLSGNITVSSSDFLFTTHEPLGPVDQSAVLSDGDANLLINEHVSPFSDYNTRAPTLLLGRKGSGKSSILASFRLRELRRDSATLRTESVVPSGMPFIITIKTWDHFHSLTRHVAMKYSRSASELDAELIPTEYIASLWEEAIWDEIIKHFYGYCHEYRDDLKPVEDYILADGSSFGAAESGFNRRLALAKEAVLIFLKERHSRVILLIDSMELYPVRNLIFSEILGGLIKGIRAVNYQAREVEITFCLPEEIEGHLISSSSNLEKDYSSIYRIKWKPIDLLKVVAHRYRLYSRLSEPQLYANSSQLDFENRDHIHQFFAMIMPSDFRNSLGEAEDSLAFIIRHTQLLPRHIIAMFNSIVSISMLRTGQANQLRSDCILEGVAEGTRLIAQQVLLPYQRIYPELIEACEQYLSELPMIFPYHAMQRLQSRFHRRIESDVTNVWRTLLQIGILGKVVDPTKSTFGNAISRYSLAQFYYNTEGGLGLSTDAEYCFHPIFARHYGINYSKLDLRKTVYPANINLENI